MKFGTYKRILTVSLALAGTPPALAQSIGSFDPSAGIQTEMTKVSAEVSDNLTLRPSEQARRLVDVPDEVIYELAHGRVDIWNRWIADQRSLYPHEPVGGRFSHILVDNLKGQIIVLKNADFSYSRFEASKGNKGSDYNKFSNVDLEGSNFYGAQLDGVFFEGEIHNGNFSGARFIRSANQETTDKYTTRAHFFHCSFTDTLIDPDAYFHFSKISQSDFARADIQSRNWLGAEIDPATLATSPALQTAIREANTPRPSNKDVAIPASITNPEDQIRYLLSHNRGLFDGDIHDNLAFPEYMAAHMAMLKEEKVTLMFLEMVDVKNQKMIDDFYNCMDGADVKLLEDMREHWGHSRGSADARFALILAAREAGIRTVGIGWNGHKAVAYPSLSKWAGAQGDDLNEGWINTIKTYLRALPADERFIIYGGANHGSFAPGRNGVDAHFGIPSIKLVKAGSSEARFSPTTFTLLPSKLPTDSDFIAVLPDSPYQGKGYGETDLASVIGLKLPLRACIASKKMSGFDQN